jgi:hypothetical protein
MQRRRGNTQGPPAHVVFFFFMAMLGDGKENQKHSHAWVEIDDQTSRGCPAQTNSA